MKTPTKLGAFVLSLGVVFAAAYWAGTFTDPIAASDTSGHPMPSATGAHETSGGHEAERATANEVGGLAVSADGFTMRQMSGGLSAGTTTEFIFQIGDEHSRPVTGFQISHEKQLHLIVVRRDLTGFQHLHPQMSADGTWRTPLTLPNAGDWRAFADFVPEGRDRQVILGLDLAVAGPYQPQPLPEPAPTSSVDEYTVTIDGHLVAGQASRLTLTVSLAGQPVTDLQPYLGSYGHLVALRAGDLGYLHVHPQQTSAAGPTIAFDVDVATAGAYRLFLDFQHNGVVRTAMFTAIAV